MLALFPVALLLTAAVALGGGILGCLVIRRWFLDRGRRGLARLWPWALLSAAALLGLATAPLVAASRAEARSGWSDVDGDGMVDGFANGSGDWLDINGDAFIASWILGAVLCLVVLLAGGWYLTRYRLARPLVP